MSFRPYLAGNLAGNLTGNLASNLAMEHDAAAAANEDAAKMHARIAEGQRRAAADLEGRCDAAPADLAAAAQAELARLAAAHESSAKLHARVAESQRRAAADLEGKCDAAPVATAPPKAMQAIMAGVDNELRFEDPEVKALLQQIFQIPAYTTQLFAFPVHAPHVRCTYFGRPGVPLPGVERGSVFELPPSNEPERVGYRINRAIDLYKDAYCYDRDHASVPVLAHPEVECKRRVDAWVRARLPRRSAPAAPYQPVSCPPFGNQWCPPPVCEQRRR